MHASEFGHEKMVRAEMKMLHAKIKFDHWKRERAKPGVTAAAGSASELGRKPYEIFEMRSQEVIDRFDNWFNAKYAVWQTSFKASTSKASSQAARRPVDPVVTGLIGCGTGCILISSPYLGAALLFWAAVRTARRHVVMCIDTGTAESLFRWAPESLQRHKLNIINHLRNEVASARGLSSGDAKYVDLSHLDHGADPMASKPSLDYTPEELWKDAMNSLTSHEYVREVIGEQVRALDEPANVLYRIVQGMPEVYMSWNIAGEKLQAEIQVKAFGPVVDFIYVFPRSQGRYEFDRKGFVIRPKGAWYMNYGEMPGAQDRPDGPLKKGFKPFGERKGAFEDNSDFFVRNFRE